MKGKRRFVGWHADSLLWLQQVYRLKIDRQIFKITYYYILISLITGTGMGSFLKKFKNVAG